MCEDEECEKEGRGIEVEIQCIAVAKEGKFKESTQRADLLQERLSGVANHDRAIVYCLEWK